MNETMALEGITLHVQDVEASRAFYMKLPGAQLLVHRPGFLAILQLGPCRLGLLRNDELPFHLEVDVDDADAAYAQVQAWGMTPDGPPEDKPWGERDFYVRDPDGNVVEFSSRRA